MGHTSFAVLFLALLALSYSSSSHAEAFDHKPVVAFYYPWYDFVDGTYVHWQHRILPHWNEAIRSRYPQGTYYPPDDIGSAYYPSRGCYSTRDASVLDEHMRELREAGVDVIAVSWWGPEFREGSVDGEGVKTDNAMPLLLERAQAGGVKVAIHLEPYGGRDATMLREDLEYLNEKYISHPAIYRHKNADGQALPLYFVYDSYHIPTSDWAEILGRESPQSIRNTALDGVYVSLYLDHQNDDLVTSGGFDGIYTYFASDVFTYASNPSNWPKLADWAASRNLLFFPSVGPGYDDTRIRPWNKVNKRNRNGTEYYDKLWKAAVSCNPSGGVTITSYNEWGEGTQIEPAVEGRRVGPDGANGAYSYPSYADGSGNSDPMLYMKQTLYWAGQLRALSDAAHDEGIKDEI